MEQWLVIGINGVTCAGKTTLAKNLHDFFRESTSFFKNQNRNIDIGQVHLINQDTYFLPESSTKHTWVESLNHINWDIITAFDMEKMCKDIMELLGPKFFLYHTKSMEQSMQVDDNLFSDHIAPSGSVFTKLNILILEGLIIFNHPFTLDLCNVKYHLHVPYERCYERRIVRVYEPPDVPGYFEMIVWPMYDKHFKEIWGRSDIVYLNGEVPCEKIFNFVIDSVRQQI